MNYQIHFDKKFYQDKKTGYWISTTEPRIRAHVFVWKVFNGEIPKGYHIHHIDENKSNNDIKNLALMSSKEHLIFHMSKEENRLRSAQHAEKIRPLSKKWHSSEEGKVWHRKHGIKTWKERKQFSSKCLKCQSEFYTKTYHQEFCSNVCKSSWRRKQGIDDIEKKCPICEKEYKVNKYSKTKTCGRKCGKLLKNKIH